jgi:hypothetical protein
LLLLLLLLLLLHVTSYRLSAASQHYWRAADSP